MRLEIHTNSAIMTSPKSRAMETDGTLHSSAIARAHKKIYYTPWSSRYPFIPFQGVGVHLLHRGIRRGCDILLQSRTYTTLLFPTPFHARRHILPPARLHFRVLSGLPVARGGVNATSFHRLGWVGASSGEERDYVRR